MGPSSFVLLANASLIFRIDTDLVQLAVKTLKTNDYHLFKVENKSQLLAIFRGLASISATTRSRSLAEELRFLLRKYMRDAQYGISVLDSMIICLVASASCKSMREWREFAGEWLTELAFTVSEVNEGIIFQSHLKRLCHVVP
ncbi:MAG: hypothetical protein OEU84_15455, partial [Xanthomonadales bacterium]|nr:hypothetical protein [Xanthomonadales bacterium]